MNPTNTPIGDSEGWAIPPTIDLVWEATQQVEVAGKRRFSMRRLTTLLAVAAVVLILGTAVFGFLLAKNHAAKKAIADDIVGVWTAQSVVEFDEAGNLESGFTPDRIFISWVFCEDGTYTLYGLDEWMIKGEWFIGDGGTNGITYFLTTPYGSYSTIELGVHYSIVSSKRSLILDGGAPSDTLYFVKRVSHDPDTLQSLYLESTAAAAPLLH